MTKFASIQISRSRVNLWLKRNEGLPAITTPMCLISIRHDDQSGQLVLNTTEDMDEALIRAALFKAAEMMDP